MPDKGFIRTKLNEIEQLLPEIDDFDKIRLAEAIREHLPAKVWDDYFK